jgi:VWFA-related protein
MRRHLFLLPIALLSAVILGAGIVGAQQPPAQPANTTQQPADATQESVVTFRTETNFVEVHAIVTDDDGEFVRGLTLDDFEIYEDGQRQAPTVFSLVDVPIERRFAPMNPDGTIAEPIEPDVRETTGAFEGRIFIVLLDDLHTLISRTITVRTIAKQFIDEYLGENDLAAVIFTSGRQESGQELTNNRSLLKEAIDRFQARKLPSAGSERMAQHLLESSGDIDDGTGQAPDFRSSEALQKAEAVRDPLDYQRAYNVRRSLDAIENISEWLGDVQGRRKALLFFSEGFDYDIYQPFSTGRESSLVIAETREATAAAQRANVNVYGIDPRAMNAFGELAQMNGYSRYPQLSYQGFRGMGRELLLSQESLISLSEETGGLSVVNRADLAGGLGRIVLDNSRYYVLGYYSDASTWERDRFMKLDVRTTRPGLDIRARKGFLPPDTEAIERERLELLESGASPVLIAAMDKPVPVGDLPMRVFAAPMRGSDDNGSVVVALEVDGPALRFEERDGRFFESVEVSVIAIDEASKVQGGESKTFNLSLEPATHEVVSRTGIRLLAQLELEPGRYQIRVAAQEATGQAIGTVPFDLVVPDYSDMDFSMSGVFLTSSDAAAYATADDQDWSGLLPSPPVVSRRFSQAETITWFAEVYDDSSRAAHDIVFRTTVVDASNGQTLVQAEDGRSVVADAGRQGHGFTTSYPLRDLNPGTYVLRVDASTTIGNHNATQSILFQVQ